MKNEAMMDQTRFEALADAYGGDLSRWPAAAQAAATSYRDAHPQETARIMAAAMALDAVLAASPEPDLPGVLRERLVQGAPMRRRPAWGAARTWLSGAGLAAACAAGVLFGMNITGQMAKDPGLEGLMQASTSFDAATDIVGLEDLG